MLRVKTQEEKDVSKKNIRRMLAGSAIAATAAVVGMLCRQAKKTTYTTDDMQAPPVRKKGIYETYFKRPLDIVCAAGAALVLSPVYLMIAIMVKCRMGSPVLFTQDRPGVINPDGTQTIFKMYKFRTMTDERDPDTGELLPDEERLTKFGAWLRSTSLDELPEIMNILNGTMSVVGPRPLLVQYLPLYNERQKQRHLVKPGLTGLAQVNGRNAISWEEKFEYDVQFVENLSFALDLEIFLRTIKSVLKREGISSDTSATMELFQGTEE